SFETVPLERPRPGAVVASVGGRRGITVRPFADGAPFARDSYSARADKGQAMALALRVAFPHSFTHPVNESCHRKACFVRGLRPSCRFIHTATPTPRLRESSLGQSSYRWWTIHRPAVCRPCGAVGRLPLGARDSGWQRLMRGAVILHQLRERLKRLVPSGMP